MPFGEYDSSNTSMDALGLNVSNDMYNTQDRSSRGRYLRNIIICSVIMLIIITAIVLISGRFSLQQRIINHGNVTDAVYDGYSDSYSAEILFSDGEKIQKSWGNTWQYEKNDNIMKIYSVIDGNKRYATPKISTAVWALVYFASGMAALITAFFIIKSSKGLLGK